MKNCTIIGGGVSGCAAALELARSGRAVEVLESSDLIGGKALSYCCKATEDCSQCGVCLAHTVIRQALQHPGIRFTPGATVDAVRDGKKGLELRVHRRLPGIDPARCTACDSCRRACPAGAVERVARAELVQYRIDRFRCLLPQGRDCAACREACRFGAVVADETGKSSLRQTDAVLVATGHQPFDAARRVRLGWGRLPNVVTGAEAEEALSRRSLPGEPGESVAFVQCVGSRDPRLGRNYCSAVCCAYALRLARVLRHRDPSAEVTVYYIDLQHFDKTFTLLRRELEGRGVRFVRGLPCSVERTAAGRLRLKIESAPGGPDTAEHDRVVLSVGLGPDGSAEATAGLFGLRRDAFGFLVPNGGRVFVTGTCREPQSIPESLASARAAALEILGGEA